MPKSKAPASSHLQGFSYNAKARTLTVTFDRSAPGAKPARYRYTGVNPRVFTAMAKSKTPGSVLFNAVLEPGNLGTKVSR